MFSCPIRAQQGVVPPCLCAETHDCWQGCPRPPQVAAGCFSLLSKLNKGVCVCGGGCHSSELHVYMADMPELVYVHGNAGLDLTNCHIANDQSNFTFW